MRTKKILVGAALVIFLLLLMPAIPAVQHHSIEQTYITKIQEQITSLRSGAHPLLTQLKQHITEESFNGITVLLTSLSAQYSKDDNMIKETIQEKIQLIKNVKPEVIIDTDQSENIGLLLLYHIITTIIVFILRVCVYSRVLVRFTSLTSKQAAILSATFLILYFILHCFLPMLRIAYGNS